MFRRTFPVRTSKACTLGFEQLESRELLDANPILSPMDLLFISAQTEGRAYDGTGNNVEYPHLGSVNQQLLRVAPSEYGDGVSTPAGADRPSARVISNALSAQDEPQSNSLQLSAFIYAWGQFIDHDIDLTEPRGGADAFFPIQVPSGDPYFDPDGTGTQIIPLRRSGFDESTGTGTDNPREQINQISTWIDGSMIYGSDEGTASSLRAWSGGLLLTSDGNLPPTDEWGNFLAGDVRANENVGLTSLHTLFIREHNWWASAVSQWDSSLTDEEVFQRARSIVIAEIQAITYNEFLPALLGAGAVDDYAGYDPTVDPSIANEFSTAAFRMHTLINDTVGFFGNDGLPVREDVPLSGAFFHPDLLRETGPDGILKFFASVQSQEFDLEIVNSLRNFLFGRPGQGGLDLASLNIQRGRDHGLADYNAVRVAYGLEPAISFSDVTSDAAVQHKLEELYFSVDDIDLWVGALAEDHLPGSPVGELVNTIVSDQFERLRDGDRFWYENVFSGPALAVIHSTSLADVIARNSTISNLQDNVFYMSAAVSGRVFMDFDGDGQKDVFEFGVRGVTVELLDAAGNVLDTTVTNSFGYYRFNAFEQTGSYQVRLVVPKSMKTTTPTTQEVLVSRGGETQTGFDFGLTRRRHWRSHWGEMLAALDAAFEDGDFWN